MTEEYYKVTPRLNHAMEEAVKVAERKEKNNEVIISAVRDDLAPELDSIDHLQPDINFRAALALAGWRPTHPLEKAAEYFEFDFEFGGEPEDTSLQSNADVRADTAITLMI